jgi:hypothetical protein
MVAQRREGALVARPRIERRFAVRNQVLSAERVRDGRQQRRGAHEVVDAAAGALRAGSIRLGELVHRLEILGLQADHLFERRRLAGRVVEPRAGVGEPSRELDASTGLGGDGELFLVERRGVLEVVGGEVELARSVDGAEVVRVALVRLSVVGRGAVGASKVDLPQLPCAKEQVRRGRRVEPPLGDLLDDLRELLELSALSEPLPQDGERLGIVGVLREALVVRLHCRVEHRGSFAAPSASRRAANRATTLRKERRSGAGRYHERSGGRLFLAIRAAQNHR